MVSEIRMKVKIHGMNGNHTFEKVMGATPSGQLYLSCFLSSENFSNFFCFSSCIVPQMRYNDIHQVETRQTDRGLKLWKV